MLHGQFLQPRTRGGDPGRYCGCTRRRGRYLPKYKANIFSVRRLCHHSDFFISYRFQRLFSSTRLNCSVQKLICRTQIGNGVDRLYPNTTRVKITNQNSKPSQTNSVLHVSEVTGCCCILSFQGLEDSKGFINGIISTIIRYLCSYVTRGFSRWFPQTRPR